LFNFGNRFLFASPRIQLSNIESKVVFYNNY
jgi:hypothetical protein